MGLIKKLPPSPSIKGPFKCFCSCSTTPNKMLILNVNNVICHFPQNIVLQGNCHKRGSNIDINKVKTRIRVQHFLSWTFKKMYVAIWFYMLLKDVVKVFPLLMPHICWSICFHLRMWTLLQNVGLNYCMNILFVLIDLKYVYFVCQRLAYMKEYQALLIDDEVNKAFSNSKCSGISIQSFRRHKWSKKRSNGWTLCSICGNFWSDYHWQGQLMWITKSLSNIWSHIWVFHQIILGSLNIWRMTTRMENLINFL